MLENEVEVVIPVRLWRARGAAAPFDIIEPVCCVSERCDDASGRGEQVRHMERVIVDGHRLADLMALVIEADRVRAPPKRM
jgi:hypothetical protein